MTKPKGTADAGIGPHWKVRIILPGAALHFASSTEPRLRMVGGRLADVAMTLIEGTEHGDTLGFIDWPTATAVTWRPSEAGMVDRPVAPIGGPARRARGRLAA